MNLRCHALSGLLLMAFCAATPLLTVAHAQGAADAKYTIDGVPDTGQFLAGDVVLARVNDREIRVDEYVDRYFSSLIQFRPPSTLEGRTEFLEGMINKEVLAFVAKEADRPLDFADRLIMREHESRVLSNILYQRTVYDSLNITDADIEETYKQYQRSVRLRHIQLNSKHDAWTVRKELLAGEIEWEDAVKKYSTAPDVDTNPMGDVGVMPRIGADAILATTLFTMDEGEISEPLVDQDGVQLMMCVENIPYEAPALNSIRTHVRSDVRRVQSVSISNRFMRQLAADANMTYDSTLVREVMTAFSRSGNLMQGRTLTIDANVPEFSPEDTSRVLATWDGGRLSVGTFVHSYQEITPVARPAINTFDSVIAQIHAVALEPQRVQLAREMGLNEDPLAISQMERRMEQLRVEHLFEDSITSQVWIDPEERREFYAANLSGYFTYPTAAYARFHLERRSLADSIQKMLESGMEPQQIIDSELMMGHNRGEVGERQHSDTEGDRKLLFEELQDGESVVNGPDSHGHFLLVHLVKFNPGRQLAFEEVQSMVDESLRNIRAEEMLTALIERHRPRLEIESKPELLMRVRLVDPMMLSD